MNDELKAQHLHLLITPSEVQAIDDWMFKNRLRSRSEAIRRLCATALKAEQDQPEKRP